jgi:SAM-dependent methyltransferase
MAKSWTLLPSRDYGSEAPGKIKLNIGCGRKRLPGFIGVDKFEGPATDVAHDLERFPWPFESGSVDYILMDNVLEHLTDTIGTMEECHRILRPGGILRVIVPHASSTFAFADPTHRHYFTEETFWYFSRDFDYNYYTTAEFEIVRVTHIVEGRGLAKLRRYLPARRFLMKFFWNLCDALDVELRR